MMIELSIHILIWSVIILVVGMIKPKWLLFWLEAPSRFAIIMIVSVMVMVGITLFGEGSRQKQLEQEQQQNSKTVDNNAVPVVTTEQ